MGSKFIFYRLRKLAALYLDFLGSSALLEFNYKEEVICNNFNIWKFTCLNSRLWTILFKLDRSIRNSEWSNYLVSKTVGGNWRTDRDI